MLFLLEIVLPVLLRFTDSDYLFGIFKLFLIVVFSPRHSEWYFRNQRALNNDCINLESSINEDIFINCQIVTMSEIFIVYSSTVVLLLAK